MENFKPHFANINLFYQQCPGTLATGARSLLCWALCRHGMKGQSWMQKSLSRQKIQMVGQKENTWQVLQQRSCIRGTIFQQVMSKPIMISTSFVCVLNILGITSETGVKSSMIAKGIVLEDASG